MIGLALRIAMIRCLPIATLVLATLAVAGACSSPDPAPGPSGGTGGMTSAGCEAEPVVAGVSLTSTQGYKFELTSLEPERPIQTSTMPGNRWVVHITDAAGAPVTEASLKITTYMPLHDHPGTEAIGLEQADGDYSVDNLYFTMPGLWNVTFSLALPSGDRQSVVLKVCLAVKSG